MARDHSHGKMWMLLTCWTAVAIGGVAAMCQPTTAAPSDSSPEALGVYSDAATLQNKGEFSVAAEEWARFLSRFPNDPLAAKAQHYLGVCRLQLKQYEKAAAAFDATIKKYPEFELRESAYLNLGWCQYTMAQQGKPDLYAQAAQTFQAMIKQFPKSPKIPAALFMKGLAQLESGKPKGGAATLKKLVSSYPKSDEAKQAKEKLDSL